MPLLVLKSEIVDRDDNDGRDDGETVAEILADREILFEDVVVVVVL